MNTEPSMEDGAEAKLARAIKKIGCTSNIRISRNDTGM